MAAAIHAFRARYEMKDDGRAGIEAPAGTAWTVVWDADPPLAAGPPARVVRVVGVPDLAWLERGLAEAPEPVQGAGLAGFAGEDAMASRLLLWGVARVSPLTAIQDPPAGWRADGRSGLVQLLRAGIDANQHP